MLSIPADLNQHDGVLSCIKIPKITLDFGRVTKLMTSSASPSLSAITRGAVLDKNVEITQ